MAIDLGFLEDLNGLCAADKVDINEAIFQSFNEDASFVEHHQFDTGVKNGRVIPIVDSAPNYGFLKTSKGSCNMNACEIDSASSAKKWSPVGYDCRIIVCKEDLDCDFKEFFKLNCTNKDDLNDAYMQFIVDMVKKNFNASLWRIGYFDDSSGDDPDYAGIDGIFIQAAASAPVGSANRFEIPENAEETVAEQMDLAPDRAYKLIRDMYNFIATQRSWVLSKVNLHFDITPELAANYLAYLQDNKEVNCCFSATDGITGSRYSLDNLNYMGIPIRIRYEWQGVLQWEMGKEETPNLNNPHRILLTYKGNKPVGVCDTSSFEDFDLWYERKDRQIYVDIATQLDAKLVLDTDFALAM